MARKVVQYRNTEGGYSYAAKEPTFWEGTKEAFMNKGNRSSLEAARGQSGGYLPTEADPDEAKSVGEYEAKKKK